MFVLVCDITIGNIRINSVNDVRINRSIHTFIDTCKIKIPASARLAFQGKTPPTNSIIQADQFQSTATLFKAGDPVTVQLGYDDDYHKEFQGFVKRVNFTTPLEIECEGYSWQLKRKTVNKSWKDTTLKEVLQEVITGTDIKLNPDLPPWPLHNLPYRNKKGDEVLNDLQDKQGVNLYFDFNVLHAGFEYTAYKGDVKYRLGWNTIKDDKLIYHLAEDTKIKITGVIVNTDNTRVEASVGDDGGGTRTIYLPHLKTRAQVITRAKQELQKYKYNGYQGKITAFLQPFCEHGYKAILDDQQYPERSGEYILESTEVQFGTSGGRRIVELGVKI